jgi:hypothetical protein
MVRLFFNRIGYEVRRLPTVASVPSSEPHGYSEVRPLAKYSPWLADEEFQKVYGIIKANTLVEVNTGVTSFGVGQADGATSGRVH